MLNTKHLLRLVGCLLTLLISTPANLAVPEKDAELKRHYEQQLLGVQNNLERQKDQAARGQEELSVQREQVNATKCHVLYCLFSYIPINRIPFSV